MSTTATPREAPLLFLAADPREFAGFITRWTSVSSCPRAVNWSRQGYWKGRPVVAMANGAGSNRAFAALLLAGPVSGICNIGFCGALDQSLEVGDIVVATEIVGDEQNFSASDPRGPEAASGMIASGMIVSGMIVSIDRIASTAAEKANLRAMGAIAVEMEAAGAALGAQDLGVPFYCVRAVSDLADEDFANDFNAALGDDGRFSVAKLVMGALSNPGARFGELMRLRERTALASKKLGDFLAECRF